MKPGDVKKFAIEKGNHICICEIMKVEDVGEGRMLYTVRRVNNGAILLAWEGNLSEENKLSH